MIKESRVMRDLHKVREEFYRKTRGKSRGYILKLIKEETRKIKQELEAGRPDPNLVEVAIQKFSSPFMLSDLERSCPGVSRDMIRKVLRVLQKSGKVECLGRGPGAPWRRKGIASKRG